MLLFVVGGFFALLGIASAAVLVGSPLGLVSAAPNLVLWVLFPVFTMIGYGLLVVGSRDPRVRAPTRLIAVPLLLMAALAGLGIAAAAAGLSAFHITGSTSSLWYVLAVGGVLGAVGTAVPSASDGAASAVR